MFVVINFFNYDVTVCLERGRLINIFCTSFCFLHDAVQSAKS